MIYINGLFKARILSRNPFPFKSLDYHRELPLHKIKGVAIQGFKRMEKVHSDLVVKMTATLMYISHVHVFYFIVYFSIYNLP